MKKYIQAAFALIFSCSLALASTGQDIELTPSLNNNGRWGYTDQAGHFVIRPMFEEAYAFSDGLARICVWKKYGFIGAKGQAVIKPQYDRARCFSEGLAAVMIGDPRHPKWGYIDKQGRFAIKPEFDDASDFSDGEAEVIIAGQKRTIDREGAISE